MQTLVSFYALNEASTDSASAVKPEITLTAKLTYEFIQKRKRVTIICESQAQAEMLDEHLWDQPADKFIPHNLYGEGPEMGTPAQIIWQSVYSQQKQLKNKQVVICLSQSMINYNQGIGTIIDFVPNEDTLKAKARDRYKLYKQAGLQLEYNTI